MPIITKIELKLAYLNLIRHPIRTFFALLAIILGVGIFFSVNIASDSLTESLRKSLNPSEFGDVDQWITLFRGILMILSGISLIVCVIIIKNLLEMSKEAQIYELGLLRAIGTSKGSLFSIFFMQIVIISFIGLIIGLLLGYFLSYLFFGPLKSVLSALVSLETVFEVQLHISSFTFIISILMGLLIPLLFSLIPTLSATKVNILYALYPHIRNKKNSRLTKNHISIIKFILSLSLIISGILLNTFGYSGLLNFSSDPSMESNLSISFLFLAGLIFISGCIILGSIFFSGISWISSLILKPILLKTKKISYRNIIKNMRRSRNAFFMISLGLSFLISITIALSSINAGIIPGAKMRLGGDIRLGTQWSGYQTYIPINTARNISTIGNVSWVCEVKNSIGGDNTYCDDFGKGEFENIILYVINTSAYINMHSKISYNRYYGDLSFSDFIYQLDNERTIILQDNLANSIDKSIGDNVTIETKYNAYFPAMNENLTISGICKVLPGIAPTYEDSNTYAAIISWKTYFNITGEQYNLTTSNFLINCNEINNSDSVLSEIRELYQILGAPWTNVNFNSTWQNRSIMMETNQIREVINLIQIIIISVLYMALIISMFGLITSMIMSVNQRNNELGIFRAIGTSKIQIMQLIAGEILIISLTAILIGIISGILTGMLLTNVPFMSYVIFIFTVNWIDIFYISLFLLILNLIGSLGPAIKAVRINIIENIQRRSI
ncbi:MAG: FtsX-like permease family protein [Candidatus Lokiarchaeota archaeon]|nr:FtsX-like permease family protein [Candidatus Lokiarchaeota archaeon]